MADRQSAALFGAVFEMLASDKPIDRRAAARRFWKLRNAGDYDFDDPQMDCDEALMKLGLARRGVDPDWPDEGETVLYGPAPDDR